MTPLPDPPPRGGREQKNAAAGPELGRERQPGKKRICVARIGAAHGVRGEVRLWSFTADPLAVAQYGPLENAGGERFEIKALRSGKGFLVARLVGVADRSAAERLNNVELFAPRDRLPAPADDDEFYHADLIGLVAMNREGAELGRVVAVQNFGAGDLIEVAPLAGGDTVFLPFTEGVVPVVDIAAGRIVVDPPEAFLELPPSPMAEQGRETPAEQTQTSPPPFREMSTAQRSGAGSSMGARDTPLPNRPPQRKREQKVFPRKGKGSSARGF